MNDDPKIAVVVVNYRTPDLTMRCLAALRLERSSLPSLTAIVVDGGSADGSAEMLDAALGRPEYRDWVTFLPLALNGGFGWANNQALLTIARWPDPPDFVHLLNPDAEVTRGAVGALWAELQAHPECAAAGSQLIDSNGAETASAFRFPSVGREFAAAAQAAFVGRLLGIPGIVDTGQGAREANWVTGASVMLRVRALHDSGLFDDGFFLYFEEVELLHRLRSKGWTVRHIPSSRVIHIEGAATGVAAATAHKPYPSYWYESRRRYFELTGGMPTLKTANLATLAGNMIALLKKLAGRSRGSKAFRLTDLMRSGFWPSGAAAQPSVPALGDPPGKAPAWMSRP